MKYFKPLFVILILKLKTCTPVSQKIGVGVHLDRVPYQSIGNSVEGNIVLGKSALNAALKWLSSRKCIQKPCGPEATTVATEQR